MAAKEWLSQARHIDKRIKALEKSKIKEAKQQAEELREKKAEIIKVIGQVQDNRLVTLLMEYYVNGKNWEEVAAILDYTTRHVTRLHKMALEQVECALKCHN